MGPEELRVEIYRARIPFYIIAARARVHPVTLSRILNGKRALRPELVERILRALQEGADPHAEQE